MMIKHKGDEHDVYCKCGHLTYKQNTTPEEEAVYQCRKCKTQCKQTDVKNHAKIKTKPCALCGDTINTTVTHLGYDPKTNQHITHYEGGGWKITPINKEDITSK